MLYAACRLEPGETGHAAAWALAEKLWRENFGTPLPEVTRTARGKPLLAGSSMHISVSHTSRHAFCLLSCRNAAIDAEELDRPVKLSLAEKILSPGELTQFRETPDRHRALLTFWVLKEASAKLSGEGLRGYPNHTDFRLDDPAVHEWDGCILAVLEEE